MRQRNIGGLDYNYKTITELCKKVTDLPDGRWLPISIVAEITNYSNVTIRHLCTNKKVRAIKFIAGPVLVNLDDVYENWLNEN